MAAEAIHDSPEAWLSDHIRNYVESDGKIGHQWHIQSRTTRQLPVLVLECM